MIKYVPLALMCILATAKVCVQSKASKSFLKTFNDVCLFNCGVFLVIALIFIYSTPNASLFTWLIAAVYAVFTVAFQLSYTKALSAGSVSLTVMMANLSICIPTLFSVLFYEEKLTVFRVIGILFTLVSIVCMTGRSGQAKEKKDKKWLLFSVTAALSCSLANVAQKIFNASVYGAEREAFISVSYALAFVLTGAVWLISLFLNKSQKNTEKKKISGTLVLFILLIGVILAAFQWTNNYALSMMDGSIVFPVYSGGTVVLSTLAGVLFFKDKLTKKQLLGVCLGLVAVVLMNF